jgi:hypothetical protein
LEANVLTGLEISLEILDLFSNEWLAMETKDLLQLLKKLKKINVWKTLTDTFTIESGDAVSTFRSLVEIKTKQMSNIYSDIFNCHRRYNDDAFNSFLFYVIDYEMNRDVSTGEMIHLTGYLYAYTFIGKARGKEWIYKDKISFQVDEIEIVALHLDLSILGKKIIFINFRNCRKILVSNSSINNLFQGEHKSVLFLGIEYRY